MTKKNKGESLDTSKIDKRANASGEKYFRPSTPSDPHRFAHPFFTSIPIENRADIPGIGKQMTSYIEKTLLPFPIPKGNSKMTLSDIIGIKGAEEIKNAKVLIFHSMGDTGHDGGKGQESVAKVMSNDYDPDKAESSPVFLLHLGDVIYYNNTGEGYQSQFYSPYKRYPGKIIAIPGNHDGEIFIERKGQTIPTGQKKSLDAFVANFCQPKPSVPPAAGSIYRQMVNQPGVYWVLDTPFVDIIGLYSNMAENPGFISSTTIGNAQKDWLTQRLKDIAEARLEGTRKALIIAVHHPPVASGSEGGHSSSVEMLKDIDSSCTIAGITPDAFLTAHAHNYQRFIRKFNFQGKNLEVPFFVAGIGGRGTQPVAPADNSVNGAFTYVESFVGYGYLTVNVTEKQIVVQVFKVDVNNDTRSIYETVTVNLTTNKVESKKE